MSCIYKIYNKINNKIYIGSAVYFPRRKALHLHCLRKNKHYNKHLQASFNKYGEESFTFDIIEECSKELLIIREQYYIDILKPYYNNRIKAESNLGRRYIMSEEHKLKLRKVHRTFTQEQIDEMVLLRKSGLFMRQIGEIFKIDASSISRIMNGKFYKGAVSSENFNNNKNYQWDPVRL